MTRRLKVYRTPIGFHDAYVAASSQKAALKAWGSAADLFARGVAEIVTDEALTREPLDHPGAVIKRSRGSVEDQFAALPPDLPATRRTRRPARQAAEPERAPQPAPKPRPSRAALDEVEARLEALLRSQAAAEEALRQRERALARERRDLDRSHSRDRTQLERSLDEARSDHAEALAKWRTAR